MKQNNRIQVGVIGAGTCTSKEAENAYLVGNEIAMRKAVLICGGLGGVMKAACKGARDAGGVTVGVLPTSCKEDANPYVDIAVVTDMGHARNAIVANSSDVLIVVGGEYGTLSEIALGLTMGKTVVAIEGKWQIEGMLISKGAREAVDLAFRILLQ